MLRLILVMFCFGAGGLMGLTSVIWAYALLLWNDIFRPAQWARFYGILANDRFPSHKFTWAVFAIALLIRPWPKRWNLGAAAIGALIVWLWVCRGMSEYPLIAHEEAVRATKYLLPAMIASIALVDRRKQLFIMAVQCFSVAGWLAWAGVHAAVIRGDIETTMSIPGGQMTDRNDFLVAATGCLPLLGYFGWRYEGRYSVFVRRACKAMFAASLLAFVMSHSRGAIVGLVLLGLFYSAFTGRFWRRFAAVAVIAIGLVLVTPESTWERMSTIEVGAKQTEASANIRVKHMQAAVQITMKHPVFGVGPDAFPYEVMKFGEEYTADPHSLWLKCSAELGLLALLSFLAMLTVMTRRLLRIARRARLEGDSQTEAIATSLCCAYAGFLFTGTFTSQFLSEYLWSIIGVSGAFVASEKARRLAAPAAPEPEKPAATEPSVATPAS